VRFSADGKYLATGCNRSAQIYDTKTGAKTVYVFLSRYAGCDVMCCLLTSGYPSVLVDKAAGVKGGDLYIRSVCFSPDGKYLATGAEDKKIRVRHLFARLCGHLSIQALQIWDIKAGSICHVFEGHQQEIYSLDFSQDGRLIVSGSGDKTARIWNMDEATSKVLTISDPESSNNDAGVTSVAISPNGQLVAAGSLDAIVRIWDVATGNLLERLRGHRDSVYSVAFTPDGKGLVSGSLDKTLKYWDVTGLMSVKGRKEGANGSSVNGPGGSANGKKDGDSQCTMNFTGHKVRAYFFGSTPNLFLTSHSKDYVLSVAVSHDGQWVVSGSKDRGVQFWDSHTATVQFMLQGHKNSGSFSRYLFSFSSLNSFLRLYSHFNRP
jgi:glucose repression regulatory protein TUP1